MAAALVIGVTKTGIPGIGILAVTLLATAMPENTKLSVGAMLPMLIVADVFAVIYYRRKAQWKYLWRILPPAAVGIVIGWGVMGWISDPALKRFIGGLVIALLTLQVLRDRGVLAGMSIPHHWAFAWSLGLLAGVVTFLSNAAGPIVIVFMLAMRMDRFQFIGTIAWYFMMLNWFKVPLFVHRQMITPDTLLFDLKLVPVILVGAAAGLLAPKWIPEKPFRYVIMTLAAAAAVRLLVSG